MECHFLFRFAIAVSIPFLLVSGAKKRPMSLRESLRVHLDFICILEHNSLRFLTPFFWTNIARRGLFLVHSLAIATGLRVATVLRTKTGRRSGWWRWRIPWPQSSKVAIDCRRKWQREREVWRRFGTKNRDCRSIRLPYSTCRSGQITISAHLHLCAGQLCYVSTKGYGVAAPQSPRAHTGFATRVQDILVRCAHDTGARSVCFGHDSRTQIRPDPIVSWSDLSRTKMATDLCGWWMDGWMTRRWRGRCVIVREIHNAARPRRSRGRRLRSIKSQTRRRSDFFPPRRLSGRREYFVRTLSLNIHIKTIRSPKSSGSIFISRKHSGSSEESARVYVLGKHSTRTHLVLYRFPVNS